MYGKVDKFAETVAPIYGLLNWKWDDDDTPPTQDQITQALVELIDTFNGEGSCSTGGLTVFYEREDNEIGISFEYRDSVYF